MANRAGSVVIEGVEPVLDGGRHPVKRIAGDEIHVSADILKQGHDLLAGVVRFRQETPTTQATSWRESPLRSLGNDRWGGSFVPSAPGRYAFEIEAWPDTYRTWAME